MALIDKLTNIANAIRGKTGSTDPLTLDAMVEAIAGIETSSGGIYMTKVTPTSDSDSITVTHNLGTTDILFAVCFAETLGDIAPTFNGSLAKFWAKSDIPQRMTASSNISGNYDAHSTYNTTSLYGSVGSPNSTAYACNVVDENTFKFARAGSAVAKYITGVTYTIVIMASSAFSAN